MRSRIAGLAVMSGVLALLAPASASAFTATIGSNLADPFFNTLNCSGFPTGCTFSFGVTLPAANAAPQGFTAQTDGVVVRWRVKAGAAPTTTSLQILRPSNSTTRGAIATSEAGLPSASTTTTFDTRMPITAGDTIGVKSRFPPYASVVGTATRYWAPALIDGGAPTASSSFADSVPLVNADIEQDLDNDDYGDDTQDLCPAESSLHDGCVLTVEVGPGGKVTGPGIDCPGDCTEAFPQGSTVHLIATPDPGFLSRGFDAGSDCRGPTLAECDKTIFANSTISASFGDHDPPDTTIFKGPKKKSSKRKVKIKFRSDEDPQRFQCALDEDKFVGFCESPFKTKVDPGKHKFMVRAVDAGNLVDTSPAKVKFKVLD
jgi:hypothetical protein